MVKIYYTLCVSKTAKSLDDISLFSSHFRKKNVLPCSCVLSLIAKKKQLLITPYCEKIVYSIYLWDESKKVMAKYLHSQKIEFKS